MSADARIGSNQRIRPYNPNVQIRRTSESQREKHGKFPQNLSRAQRRSSGFDELDAAGINAIAGDEPTPDVIAEVSESCAQLIDALSDESMKKIVLLKFQGSTNGEIAKALNCTRRTIERKLEIIRRIWVEAGLHDPEK